MNYALVLCSFSDINLMTSFFFLSVLFTLINIVFEIYECVLIFFHREQVLAYLDLSQPSALQELQSPIECLRLVPVLHWECTHCSTNMAFEGFVLFFFKV